MLDLKTATQGLQEEKEGYELELIELNQGVNEAKAKVSAVCMSNDGSLCAGVGHPVCHRWMLLRLSWTCSMKSQLHFIVSWTKLGRS